MRWGRPPRVRCPWRRVDVHVAECSRRGSRSRALESGPLRISLSSHLLTVSRVTQGIEESRGLLFVLLVTLRRFAFDF
jgi:hypothetical protein